MSNIKIKREQLMNMIHEEIEGVLEAEGEKDACYHKVKGRYKKWPSAYASGALVKCRKVGAKNWGNSSKKNEEVKEVKKEIPSDVKDIAKELDAAVKMHTSQAKRLRKAGIKEEELDEQGYYEVDAISEDEEYCPSCSPLYQEAKPAKGKRFAKKVKGEGGRTRTVSYGQAGQKKGGGDRISPGTKKADAYCARSNKIKKCKNPPCANTLSRKKWKCQGDKSVTE
jgi:hypothetical protein